MKKFIITGLSVLLLVGCGAPQEKEDAQSKQEEQVVNASDENMVVFPEGAMSIGEGKVKVITPDGTSENGNIPTVFIKKDTLIQQVELELSNFQSDKETFIFVDQMYTDRHQVTSTTQTTVQLKEKTLETGSHTITAVQYENNDPKGKVISFNQATFETKPAS
ncbi:MULTISPECIES: hypothetical protein [Bacillus]|uniref:Lipoprotein n=6 Tax=Bacillus cereus group TaxID=86661 RepID=A0A9X5VSX4_BACCE|nr:MULTISPECIES: hypothetical protein [Bacillus]PAW41669.1 hypothetical protein CKQ70_19105 [Bacillus toyonensis]AEA15858.1 hypothetical protein CT43_CH2176 [Bacillus thuringiensis serovar chinensis CT-43]AFV17980.1 hypothetical protein BTB_c22880 [Bacillus thuringiensis Bt407]AGG00922.1 lipoprotein, putative [Bacillus thuringiensis serovar thuringiensis str. IS5056]AHA71637.1 lipoprotein, putative [Bacillus thuringiensis YBT-1518]